MAVTISINLLIVFRNKISGSNHREAACLPGLGAIDR